jgi:hypothetical protein
VSAVEIRPLGTLGKNAWPPLVVALAAIGLAISALVSDGGNAILERAAKATAQQDSYRFEFEQTAGARGQTVSGLTMKGLYDRSSGLSQLTLGFGGQAGSNECTIVSSDDYWYVQIPEDRRTAISAGKEWIRTAPLASSPAQGVASTPGQGESIVDLDAVDDLEEVGREAVRGVETTRYRGDFDLAASLESAANPLSGELLKRLNIPDKIPVDFWIDNDDLIRRTSYSFDVPSGPVTVETMLRYENFDFGVKETVKAPPDDQVNISPQIPGFTACLAPVSPFDR